MRVAFTCLVECTSQDGVEECFTIFTTTQYSAHDFADSSFWSKLVSLKSLCIRPAILPIIAWLILCQGSGLLNRVPVMTVGLANYSNFYLCVPLGEWSCCRVPISVIGLTPCILRRISALDIRLRVEGHFPLPSHDGCNENTLPNGWALLVDHAQQVLWKSDKGIRGSDHSQAWLSWQWWL